MDQKITEIMFILQMPYLWNSSELSQFNCSCLQERTNKSPHQGENWGVQDTKSKEREWLGAGGNDVGSLVLQVPLRPLPGQVLGRQAWWRGSWLLLPSFPLVSLDLPMWQTYYHRSKQVSVCPLTLSLCQTVDFKILWGQDCLIHFYITSLIVNILGLW